MRAAWLRPRRFAVCALAVGAIFLACAAGAFANGKKPKKGVPASAVVAGTVFQDNGLALPGADVSLAGAPDAEGSPQLKDHAIANGRGEFAFYVPAKPGHYTVSVKAHGFAPQAKPAIVNGDERVDVFFQLEPASK
ncbi:MAG: carboxypeptidase-like regulatory domain-containing protein [Bryobacteraceae bacterium]